MSSFKSEQHRVDLHGRQLHFVAYEGRPAHVGRGEAAEPPQWYLMCEGHRLPVMPHVLGQPVDEVLSALKAWAATNIGGSPAEAPVRSRFAHRDVE